MQSRENKQGQRSKSKTSSFMKGIKSGVKKAIKNSPLNIGARTSEIMKTAQRAADKKGNKTFASLESGADTKRKAAEVRKKRDPKNQSLRPKVRPTKKSAEGGSLKSVPESNTGLKKLPTAVRNKMGYMQKGGSCKGMGKAVRGGNFSRNG